ncbi:DgyrCDS13644 [Dimorphilus gyrociliatus]|uniref:DgyrCDS13644 n=1 Tax=Dimorphilus gyrociliatus TaxID=2664684 RepID=A0A7I8WBA5_9ANNE|nr:DgyrCDS13644 [Dimorphilus gyrociliatus]
MTKSNPSQSFELKELENLEAMDEEQFIRKNFFYQIECLKVTTDTFGEFSHINYSANEKSKYIRLSEDCDIKNVLTLLRDYWQLETPDLIISVTGGAKDFDIRKTLKESFGKGLMKTATLTRAWIITGGTNSGVMKLVGEAVKDFSTAYGKQRKLITIGIASWAKIRNREQLVRTNNSYATVYNPKSKNGDEIELDVNHTHFFLVDNDINEYKEEINFRAKLEKAVSEKYLSRNFENDSQKIPVVCVVLEGGRGTISTCLSAIENKTPCVIIENSGRAADVLCYAYRKFEKIDQPPFTYENSVRRFFQEYADDVKYDIEEKFKTKFVTLFEMNSEHNSISLDEAILASLRKGGSKDVLQQLRLALAWNVLEIAKEHILNNDIDTKEIQKLFMEAVKICRTEFVSFFLRNYDILANLLNSDEVVLLYRNISRNVFGKNLKGKLTEENIAKELTNLTIHCQQEYYSFDYNNTAKELFVYCIIKNQKQLALLFLDEMENPIAACLIAEVLLKELGLKIDDSEIQKEMENNSSFFGSLAVELLSECYLDDAKKAQLMLVREIAMFNNTTLLTLAKAADNKTFIAHGACKALLDRIWRGIKFLKPKEEELVKWEKIRVDHYMSILENKEKDIILEKLHHLEKMTERLTTAARKSYDGYKIVSVHAKTDTQAKWLNYLQEKNVDFLVPPMKVDHEAVMLLSPREFLRVKVLLHKINLDFKIIHSQVGEDLRNMFKRLDEKKQFDINDYNTLEDINSYLDNQRNNCPSGANCEIEVIGTTHERREIRLFKLTKPGANRRIYWFDSAIHAREWLAPATNLKIFDTMIKQTDADSISLLNKYDFYFVIILNPDGYVYSWNSERFWRKNRSPNPGSICLGTDLNRNNDICWRCDGTSSNPCSDTYGGSAAASELETKAVADTVSKYGSRIVAWNTIHTTAQMILHPYGYTENGICYRADDHDDMFRVANAYADAVENTYQTVWTRGTSCETIYAASGGTDDYVKAHGNVKYSFTPELRGPGFNPSPSAIEPSYQEMWNGIKAMIAEIEAIESE